MPEAFVIPSRIRRLAAYVYETLPLLAVLLLAAGVALAAGIDGSKLAAAESATVTGRLLFQLYLLAWVAAYFVVCWTVGGQTVGMRAWRLHVVPTDDRPVTAGRMALRFAVALLGWLPLGAGHWWMLVDRRRRGWHDLATRTLVVQEQPRPKRSARQRKEAP